ncbi:hypothetical protein GCM10007071_25750 [Marinobacter zhanjiangensis]|uniref:Antibiotic biosynthesis monooxygenase n=1 Tax=Marinobacter zhanjiangensis TaxID=578215 RepID=A0ABQ3B6D5_9GAMM|nr:hypothetical protein GCM10007071_25750 [Marinobacter zhanjiangensis]
MDILRLKARGRVWHALGSPDAVAVKRPGSGAVSFETEPAVSRGLHRQTGSVLAFMQTQFDVRESGSPESETHLAVWLDAGAKRHLMSSLHESPL